MRRWLGSTLVLLLLGYPVWAQAAQNTGSITTNGQCVELSPPYSNGTLQASGTWTGTITATARVGGAAAVSLYLTPQVGGAAVTSFTGNGVWHWGQAYTVVSFCATAAITGTVVLDLLSSSARATPTLAASGSAPSTATYVTTTAESGLSAEFPLGSLTTGLLLNTVAGGVGTPSAYAGTSCANQFPRSLNASGAATCASVASTDIAAMTSAALAGILSDESGSGLAVFNNGPTFIAPLLGTPASGVATNLTGTATALNIGGNAATATALATPRTIAGVSFDGTANIALASTNLSDTATLVRTTDLPLVGASGGTGVANTGKTITLGGSLVTSGAFATTFTVTGTTNVTLPTSGTLSTTTGTVTSIATTSPITGGTITSTGTIACATCGVTGSPLSQFAATTSAQLLGVISDETGTNKLVFSDNPVLVAPALGTPASGVATNLTGTAASLTAGLATDTVTKTGTGSTYVTNTAPTITTPVIANLNPGADFTLTNNGVAAFTSVNTAAVVNTLTLKAGYVGVNTASPVNLVDVQSASGTTGDRQAAFQLYTAGATGFLLAFEKSRHATLGSHTIVQSADTLGSIRFYGSNGTTFDQAASITVKVDGTPGASADMPGRLEFAVSPDGSATPAVAVTINADKSVTLAGQLLVTAMTQTSAAQTGTVCYNSGTGAVNYDATLGCLASSERFKERWAPLAPAAALATVTRLTPGAFYYRDGYNAGREGEQVGLLAEQVATVDERLVSRDIGGLPLGVRYQQGVSAILVGAVQALTARVEALERR